MQLPVRFDARQVAPAVPFELLPPAEYNVTITDSEMKPTAQNDGSYLALEMTVLDGEHKGRKLFDNLNLVNSNQTAAEIAYRTLSAICHAVGVMDVQDTQQLHGIPLKVKVGVQGASKGKDGREYEARNIVRGYLPVDGSTAIPGAPAGTTAAPAWAAPAQQAAPAQAAPAFVPPAVPATPAAPVTPPAEPIKVMTAKAAGASYESFIQQGWNDEMMIEHGYLELQQPAPATGTPTPPWGGAPAVPGNAAPAQNLAQPSAASTQAAPPWAK